MPGLWAAYSRKMLDLEGVTSLLVADTSTTSTTSVFVRMRAMPRLDGECVAGVATVEGNSVYSAHPALVLPNFDPHHHGTWRITLVEDNDVPIVISDREADGQGVVNLAAFATGLPATFRLDVRGPLGTDFRADYTFIEGLQFRLPKTLLTPTQHFESVLETIIKGSLEVIPVTFTKGEYRKPVAVPRPQGEPLAVLCEVPRLLWSTTRPGEALQFVDRVIRLTKADLDAQRDMTLAVRTGLAKTKVALELVDRAGVPIGHVESADTSTDGRWNFRLGSFVDSIRASNEANVLLQLSCGTISATAAAVTSVYTAHVSSTQATFTGDGAHLEIAVREDQSFKGRFLVLWPLNRPWDQPLWAAIPDDQQHDFRVHIAGLHPGRYLLQLTLEDPSWRPPKRPSSSPLVWPVDIGTTEEIDEWLTTARADATGQLLEGFLAGAVDPRVIESAATDTLNQEHIAAALVDRCTRSRRNIFESATIPILQGIASPESPVFWDQLSRRAVDCDELARHHLSLIVLPSALHTNHQTVDWATQRLLWDTLPMVAAAIDLAVNDERAIDRCEALLEWHPSRATQLPEPIGKVNPQLLTMPPEVLQGFATTTVRMVVEPRYFRMDEFALPANLQWLTTAAHEPGPLIRWVHEGCELEFSAGLPGETSAGKTGVWYLRRRSPEGISLKTATDAKAYVPYVMLTCALRYVMSSGMDRHALHLLLESTRFAPRLLVHDVLLALVAKNWTGEVPND